MPYALHNLTPPRRSRRGLRRLGRGHGSGRGKTAGRGTKGQKARSGGRKGLARLGMRRIILAVPKARGFTSIHPKPATVNLGDLDARFPAGATVTPAALIAARLIRDARYGVKVLGGGTLTKALTCTGIACSAPAKAKIEAAGGRVE